MEASWRERMMRDEGVPSEGGEKNEHRGTKQVEGVCASVSHISAIITADSFSETT